GIDDVEGTAHELGQRVARLFGGGVEDGVEDDAVTAPLEGALEATAAELEARTEEMGTTAGRGLMQAFADAVLGNRAVLLNAVERVLQDVRDRLPSSDAKRGPLSDITYSGQALVRTFAGGAASQKRHLARSIDRTFAAARPQVALSAKRYALGGGAGGSLAAGPGTVRVDARSQAAPGPMAFNARRLVADVERELRVRGLRR